MDNAGVGVRRVYTPTNTLPSRHENTRKRTRHALIQSEHSVCCHPERAQACAVILSEHGESRDPHSTTLEAS